MGKKKVVVIGGGNGTAVVLEALKEYNDKLELAAIISVADSGGSSGKLRAELGVLPPGDIMRAVLALSKHEYRHLKELFYTPRFELETGNLAGHNLGNIFLALSAKYAGGMVPAIRALEQAVGACGRVYPASLALGDLCVDLIDGHRIKTEAAIDHPDYDRSLAIKKAWLEPEIPALAEAVAVIQAADYIILPPGSLYGSVIAGLLPRGIGEAISISRAKLWYISARGFRLNAETGPEKLSETVFQLENYLPRMVDLVIYNNCVLSVEQESFYRQQHWGLLTLNPDKLAPREFSGIDFEDAGGGFSAAKLAPVLFSFLSK